MPKSLAKFSETDTTSCLPTYSHLPPAPAEAFLPPGPPGLRQCDNRDQDRGEQKRFCVDFHGCNACCVGCSAVRALHFCLNVSLAFECVLLSGGPLLF